MTDRNVRQHRTVAALQDTVRWKNVAEEAIPAYGVLQLRSNYASGYSQASKPDAAEGLFFVNGHALVSVSDHGESNVWSRPQLVLIDGSPSVGDVVGPVAGEWYMSSGGSGFCVIHQPVDGVGSVVQMGGGARSIRHAVVTSVGQGGYYTVTLGSWSGDMSAVCSGIGPSNDCDICANADPDPVTCGDIILVYPPSQVTADGATVTAYSPAWRLIPLIVGKDCLVTNLGDVDADGVTPVWMILSGLPEHVVKYTEVWDCCDGEGETGVETLISRQATILIGHDCEPVTCGSCTPA